MRLEKRIQVIQHHAGFDGDGAFFRIEMNDVAKVFAVIDNKRDAGCLPALAGATTAREHGHFCVARDVDGVLDIVCGFGGEHADRDLLINRGVGGVSGTVGIGKKDFALSVFT